MAKLKENKKSRTLPEWQVRLFTIIIMFLPFIYLFGPMVAKQIYVDRHYEKVCAEIIRQRESKNGFGAQLKFTYYQYNYNSHSYTGKVTNNLRDTIGNVGDYIVIRYSVEHPNVSYYNIDDNPSIRRYYNESYSLAMINIAKTLGAQLSRQNIYRIQSQSDYYLCEYNNATSYCVNHDCSEIREVNYNREEILYDNTTNDIQLPDSLQNLLELVKDLCLHDIGLISVNADTINLVTFDGYHLTNKAPSNAKTLKLPDNWRVILGK